MTYDEDMARFWWESVAGPRNLVVDITDAVIERSNVVFVVPPELPWRERLHGAVRDELESMPDTRELYLEEIIIDVDESGMDPADVLLDHLGTDEQRLHYRPSVEGFSVYAERVGLLRHRVVFVISQRRPSAQAWVKLCEEWRPQYPTGGVIVLETEISAPKAFGNARILDYDSYIDESCVRMLAWAALTQSTKPLRNADWQRYLVAMLVNLAGRDVEFAVALADALAEMDFDPGAALSFAANELMDSGAISTISNSTARPMFDISSNMVASRLWSAQIETLFPQIERERVAIVGTLSKEIRALLAEHPISQYGSLVSEPDEVELGTLFHLMSNRGGKGPLLIPPEKIRERVYCLWLARNQLAHGEALSANQVKELLDGHL